MEKKKQKKERRRLAKRVGMGAVAVIVGISLLLPCGALAKEENAAGAAGRLRAITVRDAGTRSIDTGTHYTATGIEESNLRYANTVYDQVDGDGNILLTLTRWLTGSTGWGTDAQNEYAGKYLLYFSNDSFYKQIDRIMINDISMVKRDDGALWMLDITKLPEYALIGVVKNYTVKITLKNGQTLESMGLADVPVSFGSVWIKSNGAIAKESVSNGYILQNNPNIRNEKESNFSSGRMSQKVFFDVDSMTLKSIHSFKPDENFLQSDYGWVIYVIEQIPKELLPYIDRDNIYLYNSDLDGTKSAGRQAFKVTVDDSGRVDTSTVPELSIVGNDTKQQRNAVRTNEDDIFYGTLGQSRNYTISYKLKDDVKMADFAKALNDYVTEKNARVLFEHWLEADYLNESDNTLIDKPDGGAAPKQLTNSYSNAYLDTNDTDRDGLFDFVEWNIGTDPTKADTDGDGVPDGTEFMEDGTKPDDAADYLVSKPVTDVKTFDPNQKTILTGNVPKPLQKDPADGTRLLDVTNPDAGDAIVKLLGYDEATGKATDVEYASAKIPFDDLTDGNFSMEIPAGTIPDGTKVVLVAYSPNGENPTMGDVFAFTSPDNEKYTAEGGTVNKPYGQTATEEEITKAVTTDAPEDKIAGKAVTGAIPTEGKNNLVSVTVTYADGTKDTVTVTVNYGDASDVYDPTGQGITVDKGSQPDAADGIANKGELPNGTTYSWETPVDTSTPGNTTGTVVVTYPDGSTDRVTVDITVNDTAQPPTDTEQYTAEGGTVNKPYGQTATEEEITKAVTTDAPEDKIAGKAVTGAIPAEGKNNPVSVTVTYADGTKDTVTVTVNYGDASDVYDPAGQGITVDKGSQPDAADGIANKGELPNGTTYSWETPVDTSTPGNTAGTVIVTYPDGSADKVTVDITVNDTAQPPTDAEQYEPKTEPETVKPGEKPDLTDNITNLGELPEGTTVKDITPDGAIDLNKPGEYTGTLEVRYPDGSVDIAAVRVTVKAADGASNGKTNGSGASGKNGDGVKPESSKVKTGDEKALLPYIVGTAVSGLALAGAILMKRRHDKKQKMKG